MSLQELKEVVKEGNIVDIVSHYFSVSKKGTHYECICPFHNDSNPSLKINPDKGLFKCFVCDTAGDSISFIQQHEQMDFVAALKKAAQILRIPVEQYLETPKQNPKKVMDLRVLRAAQALYLKYTQSEPGESIFEDFLKKRGLSRETAEKFGLGYAPGKNTVYKYLNSIPDQKEKNFALAEAIDIGVIRKNEKGYYDYFNHRITFPIWDYFGAVVGFGSRIIDSYQKPKYLNSKESSIFNKRNLLYGFHLAKKAIREKDHVILVEGYMDAIAVHQAGFPQTVAIMGIAISDQNVRELTRMTSHIYLALDADPAGLKAMERVNHEFMVAGFVPKYLDFTPHNDPDDYMKAEGPKAFEELMKKAGTFLDFQLNSLHKSLNPQAAPEVKRELLQTAFNIIKPLGLDLAATERIISFARSIGLSTDNETILKYYKDSLEGKAPERKQPSAPLPAITVNSTPPRPIAQKFTIGSEIRNILINITRYPQLFEELKMSEILDFLSQNEVKHYIERAAQIYFECDAGEYEKLLRVFLEEDTHPLELKQLILGELFQKTNMSLDKKGLKKMVADVLKNLKLSSLIATREELKIELKTAKLIDDSNKTLMEINHLDREIEQLKNRK